jgi:S1-C subfamily serine protease
MTEASEGWETGATPGPAEPLLPGGMIPGWQFPAGAEQAAGAAEPTPPPPAPAPWLAAAGPSQDATPAPTPPPWVVASGIESTRPFAYSPAADRRPAWASAENDAEQTAPPTPSRWFEPALDAGSAAAAGAEARGHAGRGGVVAMVVAASLASATLASVGTYGLLRATDTPSAQPVATAGVTGQTASTKQNVVVDESSAITAAAAKVSPAIVTITTTTAASAADPFSMPSTGIGSGIIFDSNGWIVTNHHVVEGDGTLTVELQDKRTFKATVYGIDTLTDLAIVKIDAAGLPTAPIGDSSAAKVGQLAIAIGSPLGTYTNSVTAGIISAFGRRIEVQDGSSLSNLIQTDAAINPGNSGGALLDGGGNVVGINTAVAQTAEGIGFAIPINIAKPIMQQALAGQQLSRPYIGIVYTKVDGQVAQQYSLPVTQGAWLNAMDDAGSAVAPVVVGGPAEKAGLKAGDIITAVDGKQITSTSPLDDILTQYAPGKTVALEVLRDGKTITLTLTLGTRPANLQ